MKKGICLRNKTGKRYMVIGHWDKDVVLAPLDETDDQVLIYGEYELAELIVSGHFTCEGARPC